MKHAITTTNDALTVLVNDQRIVTTKQRYIEAKHRQLVEFGYTTLTEERVAEALDAVLAGKPTDVIGDFIKSDKPSED